jgi:hypothetical protein
MAEPADATVTPPAPRPAGIWPWLAMAAILALTVAALRIEGRRWWCACGQPWLWVSDVWTRHCSQHLADPYSLTHISHGLIFCGVLALAARRWPAAWRLCVAVGLAAGWEVLENSSFIIDRYRQETMSLDYLGDSVANSLGDILSCAVGFVIARRLGLWWSLAVFAAMEIALLAMIRDNLTLNVIMLIHPVQTIRAWQTVGH